MESDTVALALVREGTGDCRGRRPASATRCDLGRFGRHRRLAASIVNIGYINARLPFLLVADCSAANAVLTNLNGHCSRSSPPLGVRGNSIAAGLVRTRFWTAPGGFADATAAAAEVTVQEATDVVVPQSMAISSGRVTEAHDGGRILGGNNPMGTERFCSIYGSTGAAGVQLPPGTTRLGDEGVRPMATVEDGSLHEGAQSRAGEGSLVTGCGRRIELRHLRIGRPDRPAHRIALAVGEARGGVPGVWAALSLDEARALGRLLLQEAGAEGSSDSRAGDLAR